MELVDFVENQAGALSVADLNRLIVDLPALCERFATIPSQTYPYLSDYLELLTLVANDEVAGPNRGPISQTASEAAFALLTFHAEPGGESLSSRLSSSFTKLKLDAHESLALDSL